jgi:hypothetical protein
MRELEHDTGHFWFKTSVVDEEAIDHERQIAVVQATGELVRVRVAQRIDFDLLADPIIVRASDPRVTVGETFEMTEQQADDLGDAMHAAAAFIRRVKGRPQRARLPNGSRVVARTD